MAGWHGEAMLPTPEKDVYKISYDIEPKTKGNIIESTVVIAEQEMRTMEWRYWTPSLHSPCLPAMTHPLHSLECVGIHTCSALSVSTERAGFMFVDDSDDAKESVSLREIGGEQSIVGGIGPFVIATLDELGNKLYMVHPPGLYLDKGSSSQLRILGQQRMKRFGFDLVQSMKGDEKDYLVHRASGDDYKVQTNIPLFTENGIL
jgi:hypothetical protein